MGCVGQFCLGCAFLIICAMMIATTTDGVAPGLLPVYGGGLLFMGIVAVYFQQKNARRVDATVPGFSGCAAVVVAILVLLAFLIVGAMATVMGGGG